MKRLHLCLALAAVAIVCAAATPRHVAAQASASTVAPTNCVTCYIASGGQTYECKAGSPGGTSCTLSAGGTSCSVSGPCTATIDPAPIDAVASLASPTLLENAGASGSFALTGDSPGGKVYRARCNGVVLARAYTVAAADRIRAETSRIEM